MSQDYQDQPASIVPAVPPELATVVRAGVAAGREVPGAVAMGGTVCALYAGHRLSLDIDFGVSDLRNRFQQVRDHLLEVDGWKEADVRVPVLILGSFEGIEIRVRQLRRNTPFEIVRVKMAIESLFDRGTLQDWREFAAALKTDRDLAEQVRRVCRYRAPDGAERIAQALLPDSREHQEK